MSKPISNKKNKLDTQANEVLKTKIDVSIGAARSLINSWLPPPQPGEKMDDDEDQDLLFAKFSTGRPDRLGLGAKYLSHGEAMKLQQDANGTAPSRHQVQLKNKILNQNKRAATKRDIENDSGKGGKTWVKDKNNTGKRSSQDSDSDDDDSDTKASSKKKKTIGGQGDFLSMYLNERSTKKKNKAKK
ncbi:hypothetical protein BCR42DRAFT_412404 [Absidia repens]|uniref:Uncharacterized protein n=1 Tax=Absidia repens TaxID=90262 RepID=A0A1X2IJP0_9FUNG|nr:hypothetical protein BCR42DRAFT_412404 [Absidia repens]